MQWALLSFRESFLSVEGRVYHSSSEMPAKCQPCKQVFLRRRAVSGLLCYLFSAHCRWWKAVSIYWALTVYQAPFAEFSACWLISSASQAPYWNNVIDLFRLWVWGRSRSWGSRFHIHCWCWLLKTVNVDFMSEIGQAMVCIHVARWSLVLCLLWEQLDRRVFALWTW